MGGLGRCVRHSKHARVHSKSHHDLLHTDTTHRRVAAAIVIRFSQRNTLCAVCVPSKAYLQLRLTWTLVCGPRRGRVIELNLLSHVSVRTCHLEPARHPKAMFAIFKMQQSENSEKLHAHGAKNRHRGLLTFYLANSVRVAALMWQQRCSVRL